MTVKCAECREEIDIDDCTPVGTDNGLIYLCLRCRKRYECGHCEEIEYSAYCKAHGWCRDCYDRRESWDISDRIERGWDA